MQKIVSYPFAPVRAPKVLPAKRKPALLGAMAALRMMDAREAKLKRTNGLRAIGGGLVIAGAAAAMLGAMLAIARIHSALYGNPIPTDNDLISFALGIDATILLVTFPVAYFTKPKSRSDRVNQFMEYAGRPTVLNEHPLVRALLIIIALGMLLGEFLVIDTIQFLSLRIRLRNADRHRAALILEMLHANPRGIDPRLLLRLDENPLHLRSALAYLMAYELADISPHGDWLQLLSATQRDLRHAQDSPIDLRPST